MSTGLTRESLAAELNVYRLTGYAGKQAESPQFLLTRSPLSAFGKREQNVDARRTGGATSSTGLIQALPGDAHPARTRQMFRRLATHFSFRACHIF